MESTYAATLACDLASGAEARLAANRGERPIQVLLVEDNAESAELVKIGLTEEGDYRFRLEWTPTLLEAIKRLRKPGIDVVLLDLGLPELSGYKSHRAIEAAAGEKLPVVIFTSDDSRLSRALTLDFGASDYLLKHKCTSEQLRESLRKAVLRREEPEPPAAVPDPESVHQAQPRSLLGRMLRGASGR